MPLTIKQMVYKTFYPLIMSGSKKGQRGAVLLKPRDAGLPLVAFHGLTMHRNTGQVMEAQLLAGKYVLLANTASACGFTAQYTQLQELQDKYADKLAVIGFPANDFKEQEKGSDAEIAQFCQINFGVKFPLMQKSQVVHGPAQNPVFRWLSDAKLNGWCNQAPVWNFCKYLVGPDGQLLGYFAPGVAPTDRAITSLIR